MKKNRRIRNYNPFADSEPQQNILQETSSNNTLNEQPQVIQQKQDVIPQQQQQQTPIQEQVVQEVQKPLQQVQQQVKPEAQVQQQGTKSRRQPKNQAYNPFGNEPEINLDNQQQDSDDFNYLISNNNNNITQETGNIVSNQQYQQEEKTVQNSQIQQVQKSQFDWENEDDEDEQQEEFDINKYQEESQPNYQPETQTLQEEQQQYQQDQNVVQDYQEEQSNNIQNQQQEFQYEEIQNQQQQTIQEPTEIVQQQQTIVEEPIKQNIQTDLPPQQTKKASESPNKKKQYAKTHNLQFLSSQEKREKQLLDNLNDYATELQEQQQQQLENITEFETQEQEQQEEQLPPSQEQSVQQSEQQQLQQYQEQVIEKAKDTPPVQVQQKAFVPPSSSTVPNRHKPKIPQHAPVKKPGQSQPKPFNQNPFNQQGNQQQNTVKEEQNTSQTTAFPQQIQQQNTIHNNDNQGELDKDIQKKGIKETNEYNFMRGWQNLKVDGTFLDQTTGKYPINNQSFKGPLQGRQQKQQVLDHIYGQLGSIKNGYMKNIYMILGEYLQAGQSSLSEQLLLQVIQEQELDMIVEDQSVYVQFKKEGNEFIQSLSLENESKDIRFEKIIFANFLLNNYDSKKNLISNFLQNRSYLENGPIQLLAKLLRKDYIQNGVGEQLEQNYRYFGHFILKLIKDNFSNQQLVQTLINNLFNVVSTTSGIDIYFKLLLLILKNEFDGFQVQEIIQQKIDARTLEIVEIFFFVKNQQNQISKYYKYLFVGFFKYAEFLVENQDFAQALNYLDLIVDKQGKWDSSLFEYKVKSLKNRILTIQQDVKGGRQEQSYENNQPQQEKKGGFSFSSLLSQGQKIIGQIKENTYEDTNNNTSNYNNNNYDSHYNNNFQQTQQQVVQQQQPVINSVPQQVQHEIQTELPQEQPQQVQQKNIPKNPPQPRIPRNNNPVKPKVPQAGPPKIPGNHRVQKHNPFSQQQKQQSEEEKPQEIVKQEQSLLQQTQQVEHVQEKTQNPFQNQQQQQEQHYESQQNAQYNHNNANFQQEQTVQPTLYQQPTYQEEKQEQQQQTYQFNQQQEQPQYQQNISYNNYNNQNQSQYQYQDQQQQQQQQYQDYSQQQSNQNFGNNSYQQEQSYSFNGGQQQQQQGYQDSYQPQQQQQQKQQEKGEPIEGLFGMFAKGFNKLKKQLDQKPLQEQKESEGKIEWNAELKTWMINGKAADTEPVKHTLPEEVKQQEIDQFNELPPCMAPRQPKQQQQQQQQYVQEEQVNDLPPPQQQSNAVGFGGVVQSKSQSNNRKAATAGKARYAANRYVLQ